MSRKPWGPEEIPRLEALVGAGLSRNEIARRMGRTPGSIAGKVAELGGSKKLKTGVLRDSPYPRYDRPLVWEGDALVLPDPEFPFHHARWINQCVELAAAWGITHLNIAGDMLHLNSLAAFEPPWSEEDLAEYASSNFALEIRVARKQIKELVDAFDSVDLIMGNHEGRMLRALESVFSPEMLLRLLSIDTGKIRTAPYYYSTIISNGEPFLIEHPKNTSKYSPGYLADKYQSHVLMAHSHKVGMAPSKSGRWYGWHIGCCVDENRLAYAAQRHNAGDPHKLGAAIIRNGVAYVLYDGWVDWDFLKSLGSKSP